MRKGISPVVATVILIAVSVSIGVIVSTWITHLIQEQTTGDRLCAINTLYNIDNARWNISGNNSLWLKVTNDGEQELYGFGAVIDNGTIILIMNSTNTRVEQGNISTSSKLGRKESIYIKVNLTNTTSDNFNYQAFGVTLTTSSNTEIVVTNTACDAISTEAVKTVTTS
jgi:flagellin-like protein